MPCNSSAHTSSSQAAHASRPGLKRIEDRCVLGVASGLPPALRTARGDHLMRSHGVFVLDSGFHVYLWVGNEASFPKRVTAFTGVPEAV